VFMLLDLHIAHVRFGSSSHPSLNDHLHYPNDIDKSLNEAPGDKLRKYRVDYDNNPPKSPLSLLFLVGLGGYKVNSLDCYSYRIIGKLTAFLKLQEFIFRNMTVDYSTSAARRSRSP
jgi:hypothetical protein